MRNTIECCTAGLGVIGPIGGALGPGTDLPVIIPTWVGMVCTLAEQAGHQMDKHTAKKVAMATATGAMSMVAGTKVASTVLGWLLSIPSGGASLLASMAANSAINAKFTHAYGKACALYFLQSDGPDSTDVVVAVLLALIGLEFGIPSSRKDVSP
ncbi:MAG: hypothetical protein ACK5XM_07870 [Betaproteobacteria bacterium]